MEELAEKLRVNVMTIYRYIKAGRLEAYKIGKEFRIDKKEFNKFYKMIWLGIKFFLVFFIIFEQIVIQSFF